MEMEKQRGISISSTVLSFQYAGFQINLLDTPGHADFGEDTYRTLAAADNALMLVDAGKGLEGQTRKLFEVCRLRNLPIYTFINVRSVCFVVAPVVSSRAWSGRTHPVGGLGLTIPHHARNTQKMDRPSRSPLELLDEIQEVRVGRWQEDRIGTNGMTTDTQADAIMHPSTHIPNRR